MNPKNPLELFAKDAWHATRDPAVPVLSTWMTAWTVRVCSLAVVVIGTEDRGLAGGPNSNRVSWLTGISPCVLPSSKAVLAGPSSESSGALMLLRRTTPPPS
jgi:hypothetical protein